MITMASLRFLLHAIILRLATADFVPFDDWLYHRVALPNVNIYFRYPGTGPPVLLVLGYAEHSISAHQSYKSSH